MAKQEQVLILTPPHELKFRGPFTEVVSSELKLKNPSSKRVLFKVKTTAPKRYCVRPNSGLIEPDSAVTVSVMLQPFDFDQNEKNKHKFMVQTMFAPDGLIDNQDQLWKDATPEMLMDSKLKCMFEPAASDMSQAKAQNTSQLYATASGDENIAKPASTKPVQAAAPAVENSSSKVTSTDTDMRRQLDTSSGMSDAMKRLVDENNRLKDEGIRLRKVAMTDSTSASSPIIQSRSRQAEQAKPLVGLPSVAIILAILILGILIGKFLL
jgi:vesicle-associated membrane protein-associated protein A